eukprot:317342_1
MTTITDDTLPKKRRFYFPGFDAWVVLPSKSLPQYTRQFTDRNRNGKRGQKSYTTLDDFYDGWSSTKSLKQLERVITMHQTFTKNSRTLKQFYKEKQWVFGSTTSEIKRKKK